MNRLIHYGAVLLTIAAISAGILAKVNTLTAPVIAENAMKAVNVARKEVLPEASTFDGEALVSGELEFVPGTNEAGEVVGYVVTVSQNGYAGPINFVLGFDVNGDITGLNVISNTETPGLGSKITNPDWLALWKGRDSSYEFDKGVDAFAGATISPEAVYTGMMRALKTYEEVKN